MGWTSSWTSSQAFLDLAFLGDGYVHAAQSGGAKAGQAMVFSHHVGI